MVFAGAPTRALGCAWRGNLAPRAALIWTARPSSRVMTTSSVPRSRSIRWLADRAVTHQAVPAVALAAVGSAVEPSVAALPPGTRADRTNSARAGNAGRRPRPTPAPELVSPVQPPARSNGLIGRSPGLTSVWSIRGRITPPDDVDDQTNQHVSALARPGRASPPPGWSSHRARGPAPVPPGAGPAPAAPRPRRRRRGPSGRGGR